MIIFIFSLDLKALGLQPLFKEAFVFVKKGRNSRLFLSQRCTKVVLSKVKFLCVSDWSICRSLPPLPAGVGQRVGSRQPQHLGARDAVLAGDGGRGARQPARAARARAQQPSRQAPQAAQADSERYRGQVLQV